jgi:hypothetical protein
MNQTLYSAELPLVSLFNRLDISVVSVGYNGVISGRDLSAPTVRTLLPKNAAHPIETTAHFISQPLCIFQTNNPIKVAIL